jgi:hypothetical protein
MTKINLNNSDDFVKEFKVFNDGNADVVDNVRVRIEKKSTTDNDKKPAYKLIAADDKGEVNEGFYYQEPDANGETKGFDNYQAQKLIRLAKGVLGNDVEFPVFNSPKETLDGVMKMVAPALNKPFRVAVCYGTVRRKSAYLGFKSFGSFIQPMTEPNSLSLDASDSTIRGTTLEKSTPTNELIDNMNMGSTVGTKNLDWLNQ